LENEGSASKRIRPKRAAIELGETVDSSKGDRVLNFVPSAPGRCGFKKNFQYRALVLVGAKNDDVESVASAHADWKRKGGIDPPPGWESGRDVFSLFKSPGGGGAGRSENRGRGGGFLHQIKNTTSLS